MITIDLPQDGSDVTSALAALIAGSPDGETFDFGGGRYRVEGGLKIIQRNNLTFVNGTMYVNSVGPLGSNGRSTRSHVQVSNSSYITFTNISVQSTDVEDPNALGYAKYLEAYEAEHAFLVQGSDHVTITGGTAWGIWGDGVNLSGTDLRGASTDAIVDGLTVAWNGRQGISMTNVDGAALNNVVIQNARRTAYDFEPNRLTDYARNISIVGGSVKARLMGFSPGGIGDVSDILIKDVGVNHVSGIASSNASDSRLPNRRNFTIDHLYRTIATNQIDRSGGSTFVFGAVDNVIIKNCALLHNPRNSLNVVLLNGCGGANVIFNNDFTGAGTVWQTGTARNGTIPAGPNPCSVNNKPSGQDVA